MMAVHPHERHCSLNLSVCRPKSLMFEYPPCSKLLRNDTSAIGHADGKEGAGLWNSGYRQRVPAVGSFSSTLASWTN